MPNLSYIKRPVYKKATLISGADKMVDTKPLIKWPGGKSEEFKYIENMIPSFERYIEPFFGGGAVFFKLRPSRSIINDSCGELIDFYKFIKDEHPREKFRVALYEYVDNWEKIPYYVSLFENKFVDLYRAYRNDKIDSEIITEKVSIFIKEQHSRFNGLFSKRFCIDEANLSRQIVLNIVSKLRRIKYIEQARGTLSSEDLENNIQTSFRSGFYMHFRDLLNLNGTSYNLSGAKKIANYYFIREFCYGSMFRFNSGGFFNIPYGGNAYNDKDFRKKVDRIFDQELRPLFAKASIKNWDFEKIFTSYALSDKDFIFLDPPYDSDFSEYENQAFTKADHARLARCLIQTKAKFVLIVNETPFTLGLYNNKKKINIKKFNKRYVYNMKGRNEQAATHLVIYNF